MSSASFRLTYDGPALATSQMDVRELAPALLAVGDLVNAATLVLCGTGSTAQVHVRGSFRTGSFGIDLSVVTSLASRVRDFFASDTATAVANAAAILSLLGLAHQKTGSPVTKGLFAVIRWIQGRRISRVVLKEDTAILQIEDDALEIERAVLDLLRDVEVRKHCAGVMLPLTRAGVTILAIGEDPTVPDAVFTAEDAQWFSPPESQDEPINDATYVAALTVVSLSFARDNKWRLSDGASTVHYAIEDSDFLQNVAQRGMTFGSGDVLLCEVRLRQWLTAAGTRTEQTIIKVLEHRQAARQLPLPGLENT